jgi:anion-transporting  ArsA/GET3 family ATPase
VHPDDADDEKVVDVLSPHKDIAKRVEEELDNHRSPKKSKAIKVANGNTKTKSPLGDFVQELANKDIGTYIAQES